MIAVIALDERHIEQAKKVSEQLNFPLLPIGTDPSRCDVANYLLLVGDAGLSLLQTGRKPPGAVTVDFMSGATNHRRVQGGGKSQLIAKSVGLHQGAKPSVLDITAGLGSDAFVLASLGCSVTMVEQSSVVAVLLADGLSRAKGEMAIRDIMSRMSLVHADSIVYMESIDEAQRPDVIYVDPMFPERTKKAKVKKEMSLFHDIVGVGDNDSLLLEAALQNARCRVVVKRPKGADSIAGKSPTYQLKGKSSRFDIYALQKLMS